VARVVLGWAPESRNWHLGLMLAARPETNFHTRWCGLASWPSGVAGEYMESAKRAGQVLARIIDRPFHLVPPAEPVRVAIDDTQPLQATVQIEAASVREAALHAVQLKAPPLEFDEWTLVAVPRGLIWQRRGRWVMLSAARAIGLAVLSVLFLLLGIGAQTRGLADVKPSWLPWLGIAVAGALVAVAFANIGAMLAASDVMIDTARREVRRRSRLLGAVRWRLPFDSTAYVLVSQTPPRPEGHPRADEPMATAQEVWLHLYDGHRFWPVVELGRVEGRCQDWDNVRHRLKTPGRRALKLAYFDTPAHHAAQVMAQALNVDVWLDVRS
jgi:hypothetical protein